MLIFNLINLFVLRIVSILECRFAAYYGRIESPGIVLFEFRHPMPPKLQSAQEEQVECQL